MTLSPTSRRLGLLITVAVLPACVTRTVTSVQRAMLAPLPPPPLLNFDGAHGGQLSAIGQLHPFAVAPTTTTSGIGVPRGQAGLAPMIRVSPKFSFGGAVEYIPAAGAQFRNTSSGAIAGRSSDAFGVVLAGHFATFDVDGFGVDGAVQVSLHGLPVSLGNAAGPLGNQPTNAFATSVTAVPGLAVTLLPRFTGRYGTLFAGLGAHTNADIEARGLRILEAGRVVADDEGGLREIFGQVGAGYSVTFPFGGGLSAQLWLPLGADRIGYGPTLTVALHVGFGAPPAPRPPPRSLPSPFPADDLDDGPPPPPPLVPPTAPPL